MSQAMQQDDTGKWKQDGLAEMQVLMCCQYFNRGHPQNVTHPSSACERFKVAGVSGKQGAGGEAEGKKIYTFV